MCFYSNKTTSKQIATEDIVVYKECKLRTRPFSKKLYLCGGVYDHYIYSLTNWSPIKVSKGIFPAITHGFHSNIYRKRYDNTSWIIPKGSIYYKNDTEYVSNRLVFKEFITEQYMSAEDVVIHTDSETFKVRDLKGPIPMMHFRKFNFFSNLHSIFKYIL